MYEVIDEIIWNACNVQLMSQHILLMWNTSVD